MQVISKKVHVDEFISNFEKMASYDFEKEKHYFVFYDKERGGQLTLMKSKDNCWTIHGKGEKYCDLCETVLEKSEVQLLIWKNRAAINQQCKKVQVV